MTKETLFYGFGMTGMQPPANGFVQQNKKVLDDENGNASFYITYHLDTTTNKLVGDYNITYYYSEHGFNAQTPETQINIYPNPASEYVIFNLTDISDYATVEEFNDQGKKILEQKLPVNGQIFISHLAKGLYLYRINNNGTIHKGKIIIV